MNKFKWIIIPAIIMGMLSFNPVVKAEEKPWHLRATTVEVADVLENWLRKVMWDEKMSLEGGAEYFWSMFIEPLQ